VAARIVGIVYEKGGTGKTTTAINLAAAMAGRGQSTLLIDFDHQASATALLGADSNALEASVKDALLAVYEGKPLPRAILQVRDRFQLLPSDATLIRVPHMVAHGADHLLKRLVRSLEELNQWDWIFIDGPPSLGTLMVSVLIAARELLIPAQAQYAAQVQMAPMFNTIRALQRAVGVGWDRIIIVPTMVEHRTIASAAALAHLREHYGAYVSRATIRRSIAITYAQMEAKAIQWYDPANAAAQDYEALADELIGLPVMRQEVPVP
jgi:chromosome partitioning protein